MGTKKLYLEDCTTLNGEAVIVDAGSTDDGKPWVRLDVTIFHPQGGGQKADRGVIGSVDVVHVAHAANGFVDHVLASPAAFTRGQRVALAVDRGWRRTNARLHSGGHLLAAVVEAAFPGLRTLAGHHWPGEARIEVEGNSLPSTDQIVPALERALAVAVSSDAAVDIIGNPYESRAIQIGDYPPVSCGGTHVRRLGELAGIRLDKVKLKSGRLRVSYSLVD